MTHYRTVLQHYSIHHHQYQYQCVSIIVIILNIGSIIENHRSFSVWLDYAFDINCVIGSGLWLGCGCKLSSSRWGSPRHSPCRLHPAARAVFPTPSPGHPVDGHLAPHSALIQLI